MATNATIKIRPATSVDVPALLALQRKTPTSAQWSEVQYREFFSGQGPSRLLLTAQSPTSAILGLVVAQHIPPHWELENILVAPESQRTGIGCRLLAALIETANQTNSEAVFLEVRESNLPARALYERCRFRQTGRRKSYYSNPLEDAILYRLDLC